MSCFSPTYAFPAKDGRKVSQLWDGEEKIVIAIDCGTTCSGVTYAYLYPKGNQAAQPVLHWPGQESQRGEAKIPSLVWYDKSGKARAFGAEACTPECKERAEAEDWQLAEHFKLHLHPYTMRTEHSIIVQPLPRGIAIEDIYADFLGYLYKHTRTFFEARELNGAEIWHRLENRIEFVITHPNGWSMYEHAFLRKAVKLGGLLPDEADPSRISFVSEAEASVHFVLARQAELEGQFKNGVGFIVCDAGGSTVDTTSYKVTKMRPVLQIAESRESACVQAGAIFVNQTAEEYFTKQFCSADVEKPRKYTQDAVDSFEADCKRRFRDTLQYDWTIEAGGHKFTEKSIGVTRGRMTVSSETVETFFKPWTQQILESVEKQAKGHEIKCIILVGGFGDSPYLGQQFMRHPAFKGINIVVGPDSTAKAVSEGAAIWYMQHAVTARAIRFSYGREMYEKFNAADVEHKGRQVYNFPDKKNSVRDMWKAIALKGQIVKTNSEVRVCVPSVYQLNNAKMTDFSLHVFACENEKEPRFVRDAAGSFKDGCYLACVVRADLSSARNALRRCSGENGVYYQLDPSIVLSFGGTEITAQIAWKESRWGKEHRGPAAILPEKFV